MMDLIITSNDPLVFRDGRPFGDVGHVNGGSLRWPWPSTISGVIRCKVGEGRDPDFFSEEKRSANIAAIKEVHCRTLPLWREAGGMTWRPLFPAPADALIMPGAIDHQVRVLPFAYELADQNGGTDLPWPGWLIPGTGETGKPARDCPGLWFKKHYFDWLREGRLEKDTIGTHELGLGWPGLEFRMHTAIDQATATVSKGRLFSSQGVRLESAGSQGQQKGVFAVGVQAENLQTHDDPSGPCLIGGERKVAFIDESENLFPVCPDWFAEKKFLRLILAAPGKFDDWIPDWLSPELGQQFKVVPGTKIKVQLRSAHVPRWSAISGWDFESNSPKATSKLVPAGSVYLLELEKSTDSQTLAEYLWGRSLNNDLDGFGLTYVGNINIQGEQP